MTVTTNAPAGGAPAPKPQDLVTITVDGIEVSVPKGTLVIRAAELLGIANYQTLSNWMKKYGIES